MSEQPRVKLKWRCRRRTMGFRVEPCKRQSESHHCPECGLLFWSVSHSRQDERRAIVDILPSTYYEMTEAK